MTPRPRCRKPSITREGDDQRWVQITHPFHPLHGRRFVLLSCRQAWSQERVYFEDDVGHLQSMPAKWTDVIAPDPFVVIAAGRALFRPGDLVTIVRLLRAAQTDRGSPEQAPCEGQSVKPILPLS